MLFAKEGAKGIVLVSRTQSKLEQVAKDIAELGTNAKTAIVAGDIGKESTNKDMVDKALQEFGQVDVAFVNAGVYGGKPFPQLQEEEIDNVLNSNVKSVAFAFKYLLPAMKDSPSKDTSVVVNTSVMGSVARAVFAGAGLYSATKAAADMLVQYAAMEGAVQGTRVNAVAPGIVATDIWEMDTDDTDQFAADKQLMGRAGRADEVAKMVAFLASEDGSFVTGSISVVDGGWSLKA
jgi:NAD(P)-dependent dehydrogenase (short-subunit alcohol dehydrogenase family)